MGVYPHPLDRGLLPPNTAINKVNPIQIKSNVRKNTNSFEKAFTSKAHWQSFFSQLFLFMNKSLYAITYDV